jgi:hypothetical protein
MMQMNKTLVIVASTVLATTTTMLAPAAEARGGNDRFWSGIAPSFSRPAEPSHERHYTRERHIERPSKPYVAQPEKAPPVAQAVVKYADGRGRQYDLASKVWFDGKSQCFTGKQAWTFKSGAWFYGSARWYEVDGSWRSNAADAPVAVDCRSAPVFAARIKPAPEQKSTAKKIVEYTESLGNEPAEASEESVTPPTKTVEKAAPEQRANLALQPDGTPNNAPECKKYFASVGEMLPVPCEK